jgi:hypothetical protein
MNPKWLPTTLDGQINRVVEESGEVTEIIGKVLRVIGKTGRFGLTSAHPEGRPNNAALLLSELADLRHAISVIENGITDHARIVVPADLLQEGRAGLDQRVDPDERTSGSDRR